LSSTTERTRSAIETNPFFDDAVSNEALIELRTFIVGFIERVQPDTRRSGNGSATFEL
jgi:hypothetical protein